MTPITKTHRGGARAGSAAFVLLAACLGSPAVAQPFFSGLGDLPGGTFNSLANGLSGDGQTAVGVSRSAAGFEQFRWTRAGGMESLGDLPGGAVSAQAFAASFDGSVIVGTGTDASPTVATR